MAPTSAQNGVSLVARADDLIGADDGWDVVLAGDVSYERRHGQSGDALARRPRPARHLAAVLIGDPWRAYLAKDSPELIAAYDAP